MPRKPKNQKVQDVKMSKPTEGEAKTVVSEKKEIEDASKQSKQIVAKKEEVVINDAKPPSNEEKTEIKEGQPSNNTAPPFDLSNKAVSLGVTVGSNQKMEKIGTLEAATQVMMQNELKKLPMLRNYPQVSKIKPYGMSKYHIRWSSKFPQGYVFGQDMTGLFYFRSSLRKFQQFDTLTDFYYKFHDFMKSTEEFYSYIYCDIPSKNSADHSTTWVGAPTALEAIGHKALVSNLNAIEAPNVKSHLTAQLFGKNLTNNYSRPMRFNYISAAIIAQPWEVELINYLHVWNYRYFFQIDDAADKADVTRSVHLNETISQVYNYLSSFDLKTIIVQPNDNYYQSRFNQIGVRVPFVPVDYNYAIMMDVDVKFRDVQLERMHAYFKDEFSDIKFNNDSGALSLLVKELSTTVVTNTYGNDIPNIIDKDAIFRFLPSAAVSFMFGRSVQLYCTDMYKHEVEPKRSVSLFCERMLIKYCNVQPDYIPISEVQLICSDLVYWAVDRFDMFTPAYWVIHNKVTSPLAEVIQYLHKDVRTAVANYFMTTETGGGWAGAGMSPVSDGIETRHEVLPANMRMFTTAPFNEPYFDTKHIESTAATIPLQAQRFVELVNVLHAVKPTLGGNNSASTGKLNAILGTLRFLKLRMDRTAWIFQLISKLYRQVTMLPLARPLSDSPVLNQLYYGSREDGYPVSTSNTLKNYNEMERASWEERLKYQYDTNYKYPILTSFGPTDAAAVLLSIQPTDPIEFKFPYQCSYMQWTMSYALNVLQSDVVSAILAFKQPFEGHSTENIRYVQLAQVFREQFAKRDLDPEFKHDVLEFLEHYTYPPLDSASYWVDYWGRIKDYITTNISDFGVGFGLFYGRVKPTMRMLYTPAVDPYLYYNVNLQYREEDADVVLNEERVRTGLSDQTVGDRTIGWLESDQLVYVKVPIFLGGTEIKTDFEVFSPADDIFTGAIQQPFQLQAVGPDKKTYTVSPFLINRISSNRLKSTISIPFKPRPIFIANTDPIITYTQEQFMNYVPTMYNYVEVLNKIYHADFTDLAVVQTTYSAIQDRQTQMQIRPILI